MTEVVIADADTDAVAKRKPARPDGNGIDAELIAQLINKTPDTTARVEGFSAPNPHAQHRQNAAPHKT
jgi:hypothetical protein